MPRKFNPLVKKQLDYFENGVPGIVASVTGNTAGVPALVSTGTLYLAGGNNITLSQDGRTVSIVGAAGGGGGGGAVGISAGTELVTNGTVRFSNSNGVSFGLNGSTLTASHNGITSQSNQNVSLYALGNTTQNSSTVLPATALSFNGLGAGTMGYSNGSIQVSVPIQTAYQFNNSNGVSFGTNGSTVTASVATNYQSQGAYLTTAAQSNHSHGNPTLNLTNISGTTASASNGLTLSLSGNAAQTVQTQNLMTVNGTQGAVSISGGNGVTVGNNLSTITMSVNTSYAASNHSHGNPTLALTNISGTTASNSGGLTLSLSAAAGGGGADGYNILAAGTQTAATTGSVLFNNSNGITFGMSNSSVITASHNGITSQTVQTQNMVSVNGSTGAVSLAAASSLSLSSNGSTISFGLASNITTALQSVGAYLTTAAASNHSHGFSAAGGSSAFQTLNFANSNGITFSNSNGSVIASHNGLTQQSTQPVAVSGQNGSYAFSTLSMSNANGISFGTSAGSAVTASYTVPSVTQYISATNTTFNGTNVSASITHNTAGLRIDLSAGAGGGGVTPVASASNGSFSFTTLGFSNANNVTFGTSAGSIITASVAAPGAAAENNAINLLGVNTAGNTTATGSTIGWSGVNITLSGTNASQVVVSAPAVSSLVGIGGISISTNGSTISISNAGRTGSYFDNMLQQISQQAITFTSVSTGMFGRVIVQPLSPGNEFFPFNLNASTMLLGFSNSGSSNISGAFSSSWYFGVYTQNNSTQIGLLNSVSTSYGLAANANNSASFIGARWLSFNSSQWSSSPQFTQGRYFFAFLARSSSNSYASHSMAGMHLGATNQRSGYMATAASSNTSFNAWHPFMGVHSLTTHTVLPANIANSEINKVTAYANFIPQIILNAGLGQVN